MGVFQRHVLDFLVFFFFWRLYLYLALEALNGHLGLDFWSISYLYAVQGWILAFILLGYPLCLIASMGFLPFGTIKIEFFICCQIQKIWVYSHIFLLC